jgi:nitrogen fixation NifU-like protein
MGALELLYQELILDHYRHPHAKGLAEGFDGESFQVNPVCGDQVRVRVSLDDAGITNVTWEGTGCSISQASVSVMSDLVRGKTPREAAQLDGYFRELMHSRGLGLEDETAEESLGDAIAFEGVAKYPTRIKCALLGWMALKDAVAKAAAGDNSPAPIPKGFA